MFSLSWQLGSHQDVYNLHLYPLCMSSDCSRTQTQLARKHQRHKQTPTHIYKQINAHKIVSSGCCCCCRCSLPATPGPSRHSSKGTNRLQRQLLLPRLRLNKRSCSSSLAALPLHGASLNANMKQKHRNNCKKDASAFA